MITAEQQQTFLCFGARCGVWVLGDSDERSAAEAVALARRLLLDAHQRFTRFERDSELTQLNEDRRGLVPVSPLMARFARHAVDAARRSGGLVDPTLVGALERRGYTSDLARPLPLRLALRLAPPRRPAGPSSAADWARISVDLATGTIARPPGVRLDSGGIVKGLMADLVAERLAGHESVAIDCAGDLRLAGAAGIERAVEVESPFEDAILERLHVAGGGIATSGIGRRSWLDEHGRPAHHLLDPATGDPVYSGLVQVTAVAPTAVEAELRSKAALLSGPLGARAWLPDGGVLVHDDGRHELVPATTAATV